MEPIDPTTENERRFEEYQLGLESLNSKELSFNYYDEEFDSKYTQQYREKKTQPIKASPNSSKGREELAKAMREGG